MENIEQYFRELAEKNIEGKDVFLVGVTVANSGGGLKVQVFVDGDNGIGINVCSRLSRKISAALDEEDLIKGKLVLEVSSPGLDQPLKLIRQYRKNIGRKLKVTLKDGKVKKGTLLSVGESGITVKEEIKEGKKKKRYSELVIPFDDINKANVQANL